MADELKLPTEEEIRQLPRWAVVAFAARCARRALPFFVQYWPDAPEKYVHAVTKAVETAEQSAAATFADAYDVVNAATSAYAAATNPTAYAAGRAAAYAAVAADTADGHVDAARMAALTAADAARCVSVSVILKDFHVLLTRARAEKWTDRTPVPPAVFDPLVEPEDEELSLVLRSVAKPGVTADAIAKHLVALYKALNEYTLAKYKKALRRDEFRRLVYQYIGDGV